MGKLNCNFIPSKVTVSTLAPIRFSLRNLQGFSPQHLQQGNENESAGVLR